MQPTCTFSDFYRDQQPILTRRLRRLVGDLAEDVAQDALAEAFAKWDAVSHHDCPEAWVWVVARRMASRRQHRDRDREMRQRLVVGPDVESSDQVLFSTLMSRLPGDERAAMMLHHVDGWGIGELSDYLGTTNSAAKVWLHRVRRRAAPDVGGFSGRWTGGTRWTRDAIVECAYGVGWGYRADVIAWLVPVGRRVITFAGGEFTLTTDSGCILDRGKFHFEDAALVLDPVVPPGQVRLSARVDGDQMTFRFLDNTTPIWFGVDDAVLNHLLYELDTFSWSSLGSWASDGTSRRGADV